MSPDHHEGHGQDSGHPGATQHPGNAKHAAQEEALHGKDGVGVKKDGLDGEEATDETIHDGHNELLMDIEPVKDVDGPLVFCHVVIFQILDPLIQTRGLNKLFVVRVVQSLLGSK